jgi:hypothetical protein
MAVGFIYMCTAFAWSLLGGTVVSRTGERDQSLAAEVSQLWGGRHEQVAPSLLLRRPRLVTEEVRQKDDRGQVVSRSVTRTIVDEISLAPASSRIRVDLSLDQRRKGLLWYDTYGVSFAGRYHFVNPDAEAREAVVRFSFPSHEAIYDSLVFRVNGQDAGAQTDLSQGLTFDQRLRPGQAVDLEVVYRSRGLGPWWYAEKALEPLPRTGDKTRASAASRRPGRANHQRGRRFSLPRAPPVLVEHGGSGGGADPGAAEVADPDQVVEIPHAPSGLHLDLLGDMGAHQP